ncbi:MAG: DUF262 domain-containing protein, partial [Prevotella sp.]|nr:DUF262 domain-containing protein [Prevotella sp.]
ELSSINYWKEHLSKLKINRYDDVEFVSELLFILIKESINDASTRNNLDNLYDNYCVGEQNDEMGNQSLQIKQNFRDITEILNSFNLDLKQYNIDSVSHLYGLWGFAWILWKKEIRESYSTLLNKFYEDLRRGKSENEYIANYKSSMQSNTKSKSNRTRRINALLGFCNLEKID